MTDTETSELRELLAVTNEQLRGMCKVTEEFNARLKQLDEQLRKLSLDQTAMASRNDLREQRCHDHLEWMRKLDQATQEHGTRLAVIEQRKVSDGAKADAPRNGAITLTVKQIGYLLGALAAAFAAAAGAGSLIKH